MARDAIKGDTTAEKTSRYIEDLIREGSLRPGDQLLAEREMAQRLNVSRPTLRQGIKLLEERGLIDVDRNGTRIVAELGSNITDPLVELLATDQRVVEDYLEFRAMAEALASRLAATRANDVDRARLTECMEAIDRAHERGDALVEAGTAEIAMGNAVEEADADVALHIAVYEASHNLVLLHILRALSGLLRKGVIENREMLFVRPQTREALREQHRAIYETIMSRDPDAAGRAAEAHIHYTYRAMAEIHAAEERLGISLRRLEGGNLAVRR